MNAEPLLALIARALAARRLEAVLIGSAAKDAADRPQDRAVLPILYATLREAR